MLSCPPPALLALLIATAFTAPQRVDAKTRDTLVIVWAAVNSDAAARQAEEHWYRLASSGELDHLTLRPGFPATVLSDPYRNLAPGRRLVVLGACDRAAAERRIRALRSFNNRLRAVSMPGHPFDGSCPKLAPHSAGSLAALLAQRYPERLQGVERRKASVPLCAHEPATLKKRHGSDYLCNALWGIDCQLYGELLALGTVEPHTPCPFLLNTPDAAHPFRVTEGALRLDVCSDGNVAFVFASGAGEMLMPVDAICSGGHNPETAADFAATYAMGDTTCVEYLRVQPRPDQPRASWRFDASLRCYALRGGQPVVFEHALASGAIAEAGRRSYAVVTRAGRESLLCVEVAGKRHAFTLGGRGFERAPAQIGASACAAAPLRAPKVPRTKSSHRTRTD